jgi:hypothetical protein
MKRHLHRLGVVYFLGGLWLLLLAVHGWLEYATSTWWPTQDQVPWGWEFARSALENLQSEAWQVALAVLVIERQKLKQWWFRASEEP